MTDQAARFRRDFLERQSSAAREELQMMGFEGGGLTPEAKGLSRRPGKRIDMVPIRAPEVLNEAFDYEPLPSSFSRGLRIEVPGTRILYISGTASVDEHGATVHQGDFVAQTFRTLRNITALLVSEGASWHDIVRTTCYLRDIERDYDAFNEARTFFMGAIGLDPLPASTGIQVRLCRSDLLIEIEAIAMLPIEEKG